MPDSLLGKAVAIVLIIVGIIWFMSNPAGAGADVRGFVDAISGFAHGLSGH